MEADIIGPTPLEKVELPIQEPAQVQENGNLDTGFQGRPNVHTAYSTYTPVKMDGGHP
jgi:hypothetical protein